MPFPDIQVGAVLTNKEISTVFGVGNMGGMRRSIKNNCLVLITDQYKSTYEDKWHGSILHYTGMGLEGNQSVNAGQNKTLAESKANGVAVYLLEALEPRRYTFQGPVVLAGKPYTAVQPDVNGNDRHVWMFPLRQASGAPALLAEDVLRHQEQLRFERARALSDAELLKRAQAAPAQAGLRTAVARQFERDPYVAELVRRRAKGHCELCEQPAPFRRPDKTPFLEVHHIVWLAEGGPDTIDNTVALCPNCHRRMHVLKAAADVGKLKMVAARPL